MVHILPAGIPWRGFGDDSLPSFHTVIGALITGAGREAMIFPTAAISDACIRLLQAAG